MKTLVILSLILCVVQADSSDKQDVKMKTISPTLNTITQNQKYETIFQPMKLQQPVQQQQYQQLHQLQVQQLQPFQQLQQIQQQRTQYVPVQIIPKQYYVQQQPQAMIIIAQPTLLPQSLVYGNPTQQLLNYFHNNPQAKYQLLHGNYQHQPQTQQTQPQSVQPTTAYMHHVVAAPSFGNYILASAPQYQQVASHAQLATHSQLPTAQTSPVPATPVPVQYTSPQPVQYTNQQSVQYTNQQPIQYTNQQPVQYTTQQQPAQLGGIAQLAQLAAQQYVTSQMKSAPAIVTGFEQFTAEQQAQIKAQLSTHLGQNFHSVTSPSNQYSAKYAAEQDSNDFVPSPQVKPDPATTVSTTGDILKTRYKTKN